MFEYREQWNPSKGPAEPLEQIADMLCGLATGTTSLTERELIDLVGSLEEVKSAAAAYQARAAVVLRARVAQREEAAGMPAAEQGAAVAAQLALARRESPFWGARLLGVAEAIVHDMPNTHEAFRTGRINERRASLLVRETACLERADRLKIDAALMAEERTTEGVGDRRLVAMARHLAEQASPAAAVRRARAAVGERHVSLRPAPDTMAILTGILPVAQGVAVYKELCRAADLATGTGDARSRGQIMADTLVQRVTGQERAPGVKLEIQLVMTDRTLFQGDAEPAHLQGYGVVPAQIARDLVRNTAHGARPPAQDPAGEASLAWIRRLYTAPGTGNLVGMDSKARLFPAGLRRFVEARDRSCSRPWCDAPIRHHDHILAWAAGGATARENQQGLCQSCNRTKEALGWRSRRIPGERHSVETTTPTGHAYRHQAPPLPGRTP